jgi:CubicO group peptidase (beta-lactamase class C family)
MAEDPGQRFNYNSGASLLLSGILQKATGMQAHVYAEKRLFDPLGIPVYGWYRNLTNPNHWSHTGGGLNIRARDLAKIGYLYVNRGMWNGKQLIPADWVEQTAIPRVRVDGPLWYGYQWWLLPLPGSAADSASAGAIVHGRGWGGQYVFAIRSLDLVVVFTSGSFEDQRQSRLPIALLQNDILPLVRPAGASGSNH